MTPLYKTFNYLINQQKYGINHESGAPHKKWTTVVFTLLYERQEELYAINLCHSMAPVNYKSRLPPSLILKIFPHLHYDIKTIASVYLLNINSKINSRSVSPTINTQEENTNQNQR